jgi:hypothetical protein
VADRGFLENASGYPGIGRLDENSEAPVAKPIANIKAGIRLHARHDDADRTLGVGNATSKGV